MSPASFLPGFGEAAGAIQPERPFCSMSAESWSELIIFWRQAFLARLKFALPTSESESISSDWISASTSDVAGIRELDGKRSGGLNTQAAENWQSPCTAPEASNQGSHRKGEKSLGAQAQKHLWGTPVANDDQKSPEASRRHKARMKGGPRTAITSLTVQGKEWPTPNPPNSGRASNMTNYREDGSKQQVDLGALAQTWPSPKVERGDYTYAKGDHEKPTPTLSGTAKIWPTPGAGDSERGPHSHYGRGNLHLTGEAHAWPTPTNSMATEQDLMQARHHSSDRPSYEQATWPTPRAEDSECCGNHPGASDSLTGTTRNWQTPASDSIRSRSGERKSEMGLDQQARFQKWATLINRDWKDGDTGDQDVPTNGYLGRQSARFHVSHQDHPSQTDGRNCATIPLRNLISSSTKALAKRWISPSRQSKARLVLHHALILQRYNRVLNPRFVEWLMDLPIGWTDCDSAATEFCRAQSSALSPSSSES